MKWLIASDIHGSEYYCRKVLEAFEREGAERLLLLGDVLYHGPRNDLPRDYCPRAVAELLNAMETSVIGVRGNCDAEIDQTVLHFPIMADYMLLPLFTQKGERTAFVTHGHLFNLDQLPPHKDGDLLIHGHTHVLCVKEKDGMTYINPGSAALPKNGQPRSYMIYEDGKFTIKTFDRQEIYTYNIN